jgi:hypothetical protein
MRTTLVFFLAAYLLTGCKPSAEFTATPARLTLDGSSDASRIVVTHTGRINPNNCQSHHAEQTFSISADDTRGDQVFALALLAASLKQPLVISLQGCNEYGQPVASSFSIQRG